MIVLDLNALQVLDSRGNPTLQVEIILEDGSKGSFQVPSGASTGIHEAHELRDDNKNYFHGKGVENAVGNVFKIRDEIIGRNFDQKSLDEFLIKLDGSSNKEILGANAILGVSVAFAKACAKYNNLPLHEYLTKLVSQDNLNSSTNPFSDIHLFANIINGGLHAGNSLNVQEFMIVPVMPEIKNKIRAISEIYQSLKVLIEKKYGKSNTCVGDEGGFAPDIKTIKEALDLLVEAIKISNYDGEVFIALDCAASDFYNKSMNTYEIESGKFLNFKDLVNFYNELCENYPIISIEDPFAEDHFDAFSFYMQKKSKFTLNTSLTKDLMIVGDDLLVTNPSRINEAISKNLCNALLLKINQIGTLTESILAYNLAKSKNWNVIVSHRSGETTDDFISDLAVAMRSSIKLGAPARGERVAKYNRLLNIYN